MSQSERVLEKLKVKKRQGVSYDDFGKGFRLGARIFDLRRKGFVIETVPELVGEAIRARYVLLKSA